MTVKNKLNVSLFVSFSILIIALSFVIITMVKSTIINAKEKELKEQAKLFKQSIDSFIIQQEELAKVISLNIKIDNQKDISPVLQQPNNEIKIRFYEDIVINSHFCRGSEPPCRGIPKHNCVGGYNVAN